MRAEKALPQNSQEVKRLIEQIGENPMQIFIDIAFAKYLKEHRMHNGTASTALLSEFPNFDLLGYATKLVEEFDSLPWRYAIAIALPNSVMQEIPNLPHVELGPSLSFIAPNEEFERTYPLMRTGKNPFANLFMDNPAWVDNGRYLKFDSEGIFGLYDHGLIFERAKASFFSFMGLGIALNLFTPQFTQFDLPPGVSTIVHRRSRETWEFERTAHLAESDSKLWRNVDLSTAVKGLPSDHRPLVIKNTIEKIGRVFAAEERAKQILLAAEWLFHSHKSGDELLAFVRSMIVLEIILGEKEQPEDIGLGELLRNRCAYLIGKNQEERQEILDDFKKIYKLRSQIVHRGKSHLSASERNLFWKLKYLCIRVIGEEIRLLEAPKA